MIFGHIEKTTILFQGDIVAGSKPLTDEDCAETLFCGIGFDRPKLSVDKEISWLDFAAPKIGNEVRLVMEKSEHLFEDTRRIHFSVSGPSRINLILAPVSGSEITAWSHGAFGACHALDLLPPHYSLIFDRTPIASE